MGNPTLRFGQEEFVRLGKMVAAWRRPVLLTHTRADGDAVGSLVALRSLLRRLGGEPCAVLFEAPQHRYTWLLGDDPIDVFAGTDGPQFARADGVILVDTCAFAQLEPAAAWLRRVALPKLAIDHHVTRDPLADEHLIDETASATSLIIHEWAQALGWPLDDRARLALYVGLVTDTGWFRFANTDARTLATATALVRQGVNPATVFERVYQNESAARFRLLGVVLNTLELHHGSRLAVMSVTGETFSQTQASPYDTEDLVNYPLQVSTVDVSVLLVEQDGGTRVSFRSKPPSEVRPDIDVATVAAEFAGGGHRRAAAARTDAPLEQVKRRVIDRLSQLLGPRATGDDQ